MVGSTPSQDTDDKVALGNGTDAKGRPLQGWLFDKNSKSGTRNHKPVWYFMLLSSSLQQKVIRKVGRLYKETSEVSWEDKWARFGTDLRLECPGLFAEADHNDARIKRLTNPNIFAGCSTEDEKKAALVGHGHSMSYSPQPTSSSAGKRLGSDASCAGRTHGEAGIWDMLVEACERVNADTSKAVYRPTVS